MASRISQLGTFDVRRVFANIWIFHDSALYFLNIWTRYIYIYVIYIYMLYIYIYVIYIYMLYIYMLYIYICYIVDCNNPLTWENCSNPFTIIPVDFALFGRSFELTAMGPGQLAPRSPKPAVRWFTIFRVMETSSASVHLRFSHGPQITALPILDTLQKKNLCWLLVSRYSHQYQKTQGLKYPSEIDLDWRSNVTGVISRKKWDNQG